MRVSGKQVTGAVKAGGDAGPRPANSLGRVLRRAGGQQHPPRYAAEDPTWGNWPSQVLAEVAEHSILIINPIIYAEVSIGYGISDSHAGSAPFRY